MVDQFSTPIGRRSLIGGLTASVVAGTICGAHAQQPERIRHVGVLMPFAANDSRTQHLLTAFTAALRRFGWVEGRNLRIDQRSAAGDWRLFESFAAELVGFAPDAILAGTAPAVEALKRQTSTIPIVFVLVVDPVGLGIVQSLARPGGNVTGFSSYDAPMIGKWLQLLKEAAPGVTRVALLFDPDTAFAPSFIREMEGASSLGVSVALAPVHTASEIERAAADQAREPGGGLAVLPDPFTTAHRDAIVAASIRYRLPLIGVDGFPRAGGLMSYWYDGARRYEAAASYIDRILRGASPAELPVQQPTQFELVINVKAAKALGLTVPQSLLARADEVIE